MADFDSPRVARDVKEIELKEKKNDDGAFGAAPEDIGPQKTRVVHCQASDKNKPFGYPNNEVTNTKYTWYNFLLYNLLEQFSLNINRYFLLIAILQLFPVLTPVNPLSTWGPLVIIFFISASKEAHDDYNRYLDDKAANGRLVTVLRKKDGRTEKVKIPSKDILCGDIVCVSEDESIPCDLLVLKTSQPENGCFIQTTNLDGETNLKARQAVPQLVEICPDENSIANFEGVIECPEPNRHLYAFDSRLWLHRSGDNQVPKNEQPVPVSSSNLIQQTCTLKNTEWIYGVAVYTGNETKFGKNKGIPPLKLTKIDLFINLISIYIFLTQLALVAIFGAIGEVKRRNDGKPLWYLLYEQTDAWYEPLVIPLRFLLLNSTMIPISLKVTLDLCKYFYAKFIGWDLKLWDEHTNSGAVTNNTSISEDLGQIEYILTDKTGTLTQNAMVFKQLSVMGQLYTDKQLGPNGALTAAICDGRAAELELMRNLVLNNTVIPSAKGFKAASPDEAALVEAAKQAGVVLEAREHDVVTISILTNSGEKIKEQYRIRQELEFTSDRKRMSVIVENLQTFALKMYTKGADEALLERLRGDQNAKPVLTHLDSFADGGLRTLMFCCRELTEEVYTNWVDQHYKDASLATNNRQARREEAYDKLEKDLLIQGCSAIEDKLQEDVAHTIEVLRAARIRFWMLTGDKYSTALQIATSCSLKSSQDNAILCSIEGSTKEAVGACIRAYLKELKQFVTGATNKGNSTPSVGSIREAEVGRGSDGKPRSSSVGSQVSQNSNAAGSGDDYKAYGYYSDTIDEEDATCANDVSVIIRGSTLTLALQHHKKDFTKLCLMANTVICCRVAPAQKAELVLLVKSSNKMTLAIGDGGNDVSMIQAANIGVGIRGKEGLQAARASDYSVADFRSLLRLVLIHGRYSYMRTALVAQYSFYKSICFCSIQIAYGFFSYFAGSTLFNSLCITGYNAILFFPIVTFILDKDVPDDVALEHPVLYRHCAKSHGFNLKTFAWWVLRAVFHGTVIFTITYHTRNLDYHLPNDGHASDYETLGLVAFCAYLWVQSTTMLMELHNICAFNVLFIWLFHVLCFALLYATNLTMSFNSLNPYYAVTMTFKDVQFWIVNALILGACIIPVLFFQGWSFTWYPKRADNIRYAYIREGKKGSIYSKSFYERENSKAQLLAPHDEKLDVKINGH